MGVTILEASKKPELNFNFPTLMFSSDGFVVLCTELENTEDHNCFEGQVIYKSDACSALYPIGYYSSMFNKCDFVPFEGKIVIENDF